MSFEHFERGYLLPNGCKDLIDAMWLQEKPQAKIWLKRPSAPANQLPAVKGDLLVPAHTTTKRLAELLGQKPFKVIGDAMKSGIFVSVNQVLDFEAISVIARMYGYIAKAA